MTIKQVILELLIKNPFYGYIASKMAIREDSNVSKIRITLSKDKVLQYNPEWFNSLTENEKFGALLHELMHLILLHPFRREEREPALWALSCDIAVNQFISTEYLNSDSVILEKVSSSIHIKLEPFKSGEYYYSILEKMEQPLALGVGPDNEVSIILESDQELKSDLIDEEPISSTSLKALEAEIVNSFDDSGAKNQASDELIEVINQVYHEHRVNWRIILKRFLSSKGRITSRKSYKRVSRRFDSYPGNIKTMGITALVALDESGSIPDSIVDIYIKELKEINKITGVSIMVTRFDIECSEPLPLNRDIEGKGRTKQGGTDFRPVFTLADKLKIPLVIIFTDGDGAAPERVSQKVLWVLTQNGKNPSTFGSEVNFTG